jgi:ribonucrease Y
MIPLAKISEGIVLLAAGAVVGYLLAGWNKRKARVEQLLQTQSLLADARREGETIKREARLAANEELVKLREQTEAAFATRREAIAEQEKRLGDREAIVNSQLDVMLRTDNAQKQERESLARRADELDGQGRELARLVHLRKDQLAGAAHLSEADARRQLLQEVEQETLRDADNLSRHILEEARVKAEDKAREIVLTAIQRYAGSHTSDITTATVTLPGDEMKGRIIGRDGRNIRAFEAATGVTVLIDDTPNAVVLSAFDPVRREIAREAMQRLISDGRIQPTQIEEVVARVTREMNQTVTQLGEEATHQAGLPPLPPEIVTLLGKLHFRQSYAQNVLSHSVEVAQLMGLMAAELGLDVHLARRVGLLHDVGKAVTHEVEGPHAIVGAELLKRHGESAVVVSAVASHHHDVPAVEPLGVLVGAADAISASRPGARSESTLTYLQRMENLEKIALSFPGVEKSFAVHAGHELRVFVRPEQITDDQAFALARKIATKVEESLQYPGQIKVTVVRETRCVEVAK